MALCFPLPTSLLGFFLIFSVFFLWDTLPTFELNFADSFPSVISPNTRPCGLTFLVGQLDQTTPHSTHLFPLLSPASNAVLLRGVKGSGRSQLGRGQGKETAGTSAQHSLTLAQGFTFPRRFHSDRREVHQCLVLGAPRTVKGCASSLGFSPQEYPFHR